MRHVFIFICAACVFTSCGTSHLGSLTTVRTKQSLTSIEKHRAKNSAPIKECEPKPIGEVCDKQRKNNPVVISIIKRLNKEPNSGPLFFNRDKKHNAAIHKTASIIRKTLAARTADGETAANPTSSSELTALCFFVLAVVFFFIISGPAFVVFSIIFDIIALILSIDAAHKLQYTKAPKWRLSLANTVHILSILFLFVIAALVMYTYFLFAH